MAKKLGAAELEQKHAALSAACDAALNSYLPVNSAEIERKAALLLNRAPAFFYNSRPKSEEGRWVISVPRKILLLKEFEARADELEALRFNKVKR